MWVGILEYLATCMVQYVAVITPFHRTHQRLNILSAGTLCEHSSVKSLQQPLVVSHRIIRTPMRSRRVTTEKWFSLQKIKSPKSQMQRVRTVLY